METKKILAAEFEANRGRLRTVAYRMLGSASEADDALQEAWLRLTRAETDGIDNPGGYLTTVVARICLDMLRARKSRREDPIEAPGLAMDEKPAADLGPEGETLMADSVGLALLVVLETLNPAERLAFVLHDMFDVSFEEIATIVDRTPEATRQLASRARRRVQGAEAPESAFAARRRIVDAFLAASRGGDFEALFDLLDPDVVFKVDEAAVRLGNKAETLGATAVARAFLGRAQAAHPALLDGRLGLAIVPPGKSLLLVLEIAFKDGRIAEISAVADPERLAALDIDMLEE
ncbi:sigma-70 family RNA polymerase sigma factor [Rhizobium sp. PAMB 3174]